MKKELLNDRIYTAYPFDYLYFGITAEEIESEIDDIETGFHLIHYEDYYEFVHKGIFHRDIDSLRLTMLDNIMDLKIEDVLPEKRNGFFVDVKDLNSWTLPSFTKKILNSIK